MRLGLELEEAVLKEYVDLNPGIKITREGVSVHGDPAFSWAIFSPDAFGHRLLKDTYRILHYKSVMTMWCTYRSGIRFLIEIKTTTKRSSNAALSKKHDDQIQMGLWVTGCETCVLIVHTYTKNNTSPSEQTLQTIEVKANRTWVSKFIPNATNFYNSFLSWYHDDNIDMEKAKRVLRLLIDKKPKTVNLKTTNPHQGLTLLHFLYLCST